MKIIHRTTVSKSKYGKIIFSNNNLEDHERDTIFCLASFGFNIETLIPSDIPKSKNPDLLMLGTYWEMKGPSTTNEKTIKYHLRKAKKQADGKAIFDLRHIKSDRPKIERIIMDLFKNTREMRRIIILQDEGNLLDIIK